MANVGKFIDRSPIILAAGKSTGLPETTVSTTLREYSLEDKITAIKHDGNIWKENVFVPPKKLPPFLNPDFLGINTRMKEILTEPVKTRYQEAIENLKETTYASFWKKELGKPRDHIPGLPAGMIPETVTFGTPSHRDVSVKELVNPPKPPYQVLWDSQVGHEWYKKTHNDYNPSEQVERGYNERFNSKQRFGRKTPADPRGMWVRCACEWHNNEPVTDVHKIQADLFKRTKPQLGEVLAPNRNIDYVPKGHRFGKTTPLSFYGTADLIKDPGIKPCLFKRDFYKWLISLNKLRCKMKERKSIDFDFDEFYRRALYFDKEKTGWLPIGIFYELCACYYLTFPKEDIESLMQVLCIIIENKINYKRFISLLDSNIPPPDIMEFNDIPKESKYYVSTTQAACCDYLIIDNSNMFPAGIPSIRYDVTTPAPPFGGCRADIEHFGDFTTVNAVINPSIYTNYGLTYRDFFVPRRAETIKTLFEKIGYNFPGDSYEHLWKAGVEIDKTGLVCVNTFKTLLEQRCPPARLLVDEQECEKY